MLHNGDQARPGRSHYTLHIPRHTFPRSLCPVGDWPGARTLGSSPTLTQAAPGAPMSLMSPGLVSAQLHPLLSQRTAFVRHFLNISPDCYALYIQNKI